MTASSSKAIFLNQTIKQVAASTDFQGVSRFLTFGTLSYWKFVDASRPQFGPTKYELTASMPGLVLRTRGLKQLKGLQPVSIQGSRVSLRRLQFHFS
jgi:hypothetical protein